MQSTEIQGHIGLIAELSGDLPAVRVELTATPHVALMRYAFPAGADEVVLVDAGHLLADGLERSQIVMPLQQTHAPRSFLRPNRAHLNTVH